MASVGGHSFRHWMFLMLKEWSKSQTSHGMSRSLGVGEGGVEIYIPFDYLLIMMACLVLLLTILLS